MSFCFIRISDFDRAIILLELGCLLPANPLDKPTPRAPKVSSSSLSSSSPRSGVSLVSTLVQFDKNLKIHGLTSMGFPHYNIYLKWKHWNNMIVHVMIAGITKIMVHACMCHQIAFRVNNTI